ncbi:MAG: 4Fe-4S dicluster domain-containing protein [Anaerolineales bacterium]|nr:4Fe-4S dicluster domain-containing protein [Anaerolineales bacterium]
METIITVENGNTLAALQGFLKQLLEHGIVDAIVAPLRTPSGTVTPALVTRSELLNAADPLAPVLTGNSATLAGKLSVREPRARVGVVLRSCEIRALVELVKMQQASLDSLTLIALDCAGTYHVPVFQEMAQKGEALWQNLYKNAAEQPEQSDENLRAACKICEQPVYENAPIKIKLLGSDLNQEIHLELPDELGAQLEYSPATENGRQNVVEKIITARTTARDAAFTEIRARLEGEEGVAGVFAACIRCHNCMNVCPICYCKTCVFKSQVFDHEPMQFVEWAKQKGAYRLPSDTMLFHLTRLNHMGLSCVGCGMCTEVCPVELPVGMVFRAIGQRLQATFEYAPGRNIDEQLPLITFKADEWTEVGE